MTDVKQSPEEVNATIKNLQSLLDIYPFDRLALTELYTLCLQYKRYDEAMRRFEYVLASYPQVAELHGVLASLYEARGEYDKAIVCLAHILKIQPDQDEHFYVRYIQALHRAGKLEEAIHVAKSGLKQHPDSQLMLEHLALSFYVAHRLEDAIQAFQHMAEHYPLSTRAPAMAGIITMMMTDMREGMQSYALHPEVDKVVQYFSTHYTPWKGEELASKKLLLYGEQGIGDTLMFAGFLRWVLGQNASNIAVMVAPKLCPLLARSFPEIEVLSMLHIQQGVNLKDQQFDYHLSLSGLLSNALPHYKPSEHSPYLKPDKDKLEALRRRYDSLAKERGKKYRIGISWHTQNEKVGFLRSIALDQWKPLFSLPDIQFVSLQYGDHATEKEAMQSQLPDVLYSDSGIDTWDDIDGLAAQLCAMDEVITIDNFIVHLAGALGVPTTLLLPKTADWRWGLTRNDCIWYQSVAFARQQEPLQWHNVIEKVRGALEKKLS